jgi:hypothetical protein
MGLFYERVAADVGRLNSKQRKPLRCFLQRIRDADTRTFRVRGAAFQAARTLVQWTKHTPNANRRPSTDDAGIPNRPLAKVLRQYQGCGPRNNGPECGPPPLAPRRHLAALHWNEITARFRSYNTDLFLFCRSLTIFRFRVKLKRAVPPGAYLTLPYLRMLRRGCERRPSLSPDGLAGRPTVSHRWSINR